MRNFLKAWPFLALVLILVSAFKPLAVAQSQGEQQILSLIYGPEWTFTNAKILAAKDFPYQTIENIYQHMDKKYKSNSKIKDLKLIHDKILIVLTSGEQIIIKTDERVIEVVTSPKSLKQWQNESAFYQEFIFDTMKEVGLKPHEREGAGHINIGFAYFLSKPGLAMKFLIDYFNHPGVGVALNSLVDNNRDAKSPEDYINKDLKADPNEAKKFIKTINELVLNDNLITHHVDWKEKEHVINYLKEKSVAVGLRGTGTTYGVLNLLLEQARFEMRQVRPQKTMQEYLLLLEIYESRVHFLEGLKVKLKMNEKYKTPKDGWEILGQFADYIEETGLDLERFKTLLPDVWKDLPTENYIRDPTVKLKRKPLCKMLF